MEGLTLETSAFLKTDLYGGQFTLPCQHSATVSLETRLFDKYLWSWATCLMTYYTSFRFFFFLEHFPIFVQYVNLLESSY